MSPRLNARLAETLGAAVQAGTYKRLHEIEGPVGTRVRLAGRGDVALMSSNDYLGLANHPEVVAAAKAALNRYGAGTASVRFICGTLAIHRELETAIARFLHQGAAITYSSCWAANTGLFAAITQPGDVVLSDELNHASIVDGCRMVAAGVIREVYRHNDMAHLRALLDQHAGAPATIIVTDGVFSMEGDLARLPDLVKLARKYDATVILDDSHGLGVLGETGRGTAEHFGLMHQIDIVTGTLGKALGAGTGGFVSAGAPVIDTLIQRSRPHLFSNALPASIAAAALAAIRLLDTNPAMSQALRVNSRVFRSLLAERSIPVLDGESAIIPVIVGETNRAISLAARLLERGIFVTGFGFPVVPEGTARLRFQVSRAHSPKMLEKVAATFLEEWQVRS